ncbi:CaiB/BaiF CoA transferase family protein [Microbacterium sp. A93]|uniref:CaiB/BaiF CoA transferase family protein n=1 Tax=Microbacterium sp. A93 TaxID=3450716 RepID=UPI003F435E84
MTTAGNQSEERAVGALSGVRVIELEGTLAQYCGKLLADLGAEVIRVEPPSGAAARAVPPFVRDDSGEVHSLHFWHYNTNKESVVLDLSESQDVERLASLLREADVLLDASADGVLETLGWTAEDLEQRMPRLVHARITPFGETGPWADFESTDLVQLAMGGTMAMTGYDDLEGHDSFPIAPAGGQAAHFTGMMATFAITGALNARTLTGRGQRVDVAAHDVVAISNEMAFPHWEYERKNVYRHTARHANTKEHTARQMFRCRDGKYAMCLTLYLRESSRWNGLVDWLDEHGLVEDLRDEAYASPAYRAQHQPHIIDVIERFCAHIDSDELFLEAQKRRLPWGPVNRVWDLADDPHLRDDRGAIVNVRQPELGREVAYPGAPYVFSRTPWQLRNTAPKLQADSKEVEQDVDA